MSIKSIGKMLGLSATAGFGVGVVGGGAVTYLMGYHRGKKDQRKKNKKKNRRSNATSRLKEVCIY